VQYFLEIGGDTVTTETEKRVSKLKHLRGDVGTLSRCRLNEREKAIADSLKAVARTRRICCFSISRRGLGIIKLRAEGREIGGEASIGRGLYRHIFNGGCGVTDPGGQDRHPQKGNLREEVGGTYSERWKEF